VLDAYYPSDIRISGIEAYDALNSALAVNFNTTHAFRKGKTVHSAEEQTPNFSPRSGPRRLASSCELARAKRVYIGPFS
jgi:hypothetical protein